VRIIHISIRLEKRLAQGSPRFTLSKIQRGPVAVEDAIDTKIQVARGWRKLTGRELFTGTSNLPNLLITEDGMVKIVDFVLAKLAGKTHLTRTGSTRRPICRRNRLRGKRLTTVPTCGRWV